MLSKYDAIPTVAVKNLAAAKKFYEGTLGLKQIDAEGEEVVVYQNGSSRLNVYRSQYAGNDYYRHQGRWVCDADADRCRYEYFR